MVEMPKFDERIRERERERRKFRKPIREGDVLYANAYHPPGCIPPKEAVPRRSCLASHVQTCTMLNLAT